jgi:hypothetical protein
MGFALKKPKDVPGKSWPAVSSQLPTILLQQSSFETDYHRFFRGVWWGVSEQQLQIPFRRSHC